MALNAPPGEQDRYTADLEARLRLAESSAQAANSASRTTAPNAGTGGASGLSSSLQAALKDATENYNRIMGGGGGSSGGGTSASGAMTAYQAAQLDLDRQRLQQQNQQFNTSETNDLYQFNTGQQNDLYQFDAQLGNNQSQFSQNYLLNYLTTMEELGGSDVDWARIDLDTRRQQLAEMLGAGELTQGFQKLDLAEQDMDIKRMLGMGDYQLGQAQVYSTLQRLGIDSRAADLDYQVQMARMGVDQQLAQARIMEAQAGASAAASQAQADMARAQAALQAVQVELELGNGNLELGRQKAADAMQLGMEDIAVRREEMGSREYLGSLDAETRMNLGQLDASTRMNLGVMDAATRMNLGQLDANTRMNIAGMQAGTDMARLQQEYQRLQQEGQFEKANLIAKLHGTPRDWLRAAEVQQAFAPGGEVASFGAPTGPIEMMDLNTFAQQNNLNLNPAQNPWAAGQIPGGMNPWSTQVPTTGAGGMDFWSMLQQMMGQYSQAPTPGATGAAAAPQPGGAGAAPGAAGGAAGEPLPYADENGNPIFREGVFNPLYAAQQGQNQTPQERWTLGQPIGNYMDALTPQGLPPGGRDPMELIPPQQDPQREAERLQWLADHNLPADHWKRATAVGTAENGYGWTMGADGQMRGPTVDTAAIRASEHIAPLAPGVPAPNLAGQPVSQAQTQPQFQDVFDMNTGQVVSTSNPNMVAAGVPITRTANGGIQVNGMPASSSGVSNSAGSFAMPGGGGGGSPAPAPSTGGLPTVGGLPPLGDFFSSLFSTNPFTTSGGSGGSTAPASQNSYMQMYQQLLDQMGQGGTTTPTSRPPNEYDQLADALLAQMLGGAIPMQQGANGQYQMYTPTVTTPTVPAGAQSPAVSTTPNSAYGYGTPTQIQQGNTTGNPNWMPAWTPGSAYYPQSTGAVSATPDNYEQIKAYEDLKYLLTKGPTDFINFPGQGGAQTQSKHVKVPKSGSPNDQSWAKANTPNQALGQVTSSALQNAQNAAYQNTYDQYVNQYSDQLPAAPSYQYPQWTNPNYSQPTQATAQPMTYYENPAQDAQYMDYSGEYTYPSGEAYDSDNPGAGYGTWPQDTGRPEYARGTRYVPETGPAIVHQGEAIVPAEQNPANPANSLPASLSDAQLRSIQSGQVNPSAYANTVDSSALHGVSRNGLQWDAVQNRWVEPGGALSTLPTATTATMPAVNEVTRAPSPTDMNSMAVPQPAYSQAQQTGQPPHAAPTTPSTGSYQPSPLNTTSVRNPVSTTVNPVPATAAPVAGVQQPASNVDQLRQRLSLLDLALQWGGMNPMDRQTYQQQADAIRQQLALTGTATTPGAAIVPGAEATPGTVAAPGDATGTSVTMPGGTAAATPAGGTIQSRAQDAIAKVFGSYVAPSQVPLRVWNRMLPTTKEVLRGAWQAMGISVDDVEHNIYQSSNTEGIAFRGIGAGTIGR